MLQPGDEAPGFELPATVGQDVTRQSLSDYVGDDVVVLAFYPADFNPACDEDGSDLGELDLFTMQKDVTILGISPDSVYSHRQFASAYDLNVPLLSDTRREVAEAYGVTRDDETDGFLLERAVFVVDLHGEIQYSWATDDLRELPNVDPIRSAIAAVGGDSTAVSRYKVGHAHYVEGRRSFTSAMNAYGDHDWMTARKDFERAREEFEEAEDEFDTALRFSDAGVLNGPFEEARLKAQSLWQAADWLADSADEYSSGNGAAGEEYRDDAESPLTSARTMDEPVDPGKIIVEDGEVTIGEEETSIMDRVREQQAAEDDDDGPAAAGGVDLDVDRIEADEDVADGESEREGPATEAARRAREYGGEGVEMGGPEGAGEDQIADAVGEVAPDERSPSVEETRESVSGAGDPEEDVSDEEVAEIAAELEAQNDGEADDAEAEDGEDDADVSDQEVSDIAAELQDAGED
jgi:peroxiredoxin